MKRILTTNQVLIVDYIKMSLPISEMTPTILSSVSQNND